MLPMINEPEPRSGRFSESVQDAGILALNIFLETSMLRAFEKWLDPFPPDEVPPPPDGLVRFLWACTRGARGYVLALALLSAGVSIYEAWLFSFLGQVVDLLSTWQAGGDAALQESHVLWGIGLVLLTSIGLVALRTMVQHQVLAINLPLRLRWDFHRLMLRQSLSFFSDEFSGRVTTKVMQTALSVRDVLFTLIEIAPGIGVYFIAIIALAGAFDLKLMLPFLAWIVLFGMAMLYFVPRLGKVGQEQANARSSMTGRISDAYTNITTVKLFSHSKREAHFARAAMEDFKLTGLRQMRLVSQFEIVNQALVVALIMGAGGYALWLWHQGQIGTGAVAAITAMALRINGMSHWIMWQMTSLFENIGTVQDGMETLTRGPKVKDAPDAAVLTTKGGAVTFDNVGFNYNGERQVLDGLNLSIRAGEKIGLVGRSGAGKSTLINLLLRFYDVDKGSISIDGQNIAHVTQDSLRSAIGMVTQDTSLLHRSIRDNIAYGRPDATDAQIHSAAVSAQADGFISQLSDKQGHSGYDTLVGERGIKLSGGQRQRVAIARVMLKNAPILLLDEATSALDSEVEVAIQESLDDMMQGKTVIAIAHRLSTIAAMDRLIVMDDGRIIEQGTHSELLGKNGVYARLWHHQSGGFLGEDQGLTDVMD
ncbi:ABC transporter, transmembrane region:ABC transporter [Pseudomonas tremae]|uniref:ABC transporter, transmembrane region:ABC transporter n=3 Tax=Pseudomonas syringae group TaxID=136849 RepID=A0AA40P6M7_9PSED|nr:ABC transporter ATP-binding protein/permease [Pseudomonas coronafaciens pv. oryzae]KPZ05372.1 ABC transporter, transmembrane region:ABC transporter [Pseudomonas tremae]KPZ25827.1 ABC transporter ATP-binding/permease protein [Pseudomonas coronafaciens pv. zizaniae]RMO03261.1 ABC transporter ATP-binding/permease protein [Pseudomonas coronafaciens pv. zizaniae]RMS93349.1 ABC transporter ATP-binding/permease protein [Pseudomonas coronafaciens pv. oryzae]